MVFFIMKFSNCILLSCPYLYYNSRLTGFICFTALVQEKNDISVYLDGKVQKT